ncbi:hypothetical protein [Paraburkholderia terrae]|nr:hypothetical protein [Paraburkholderia terrae]
MDLIADADATRGTFGNYVVQLAAVRAAPKPRPSGALWIPIEGYPTTLQTGSFNLYVAFVDHVRQRLNAPGDRERLAHFTAYLQSFAERTDLCYLGTIEPAFIAIRSEIKVTTRSLFGPWLLGKAGDRIITAYGLGVDIDEAEAAKYPCANTVTTWTQTRLKDGTLQTP